MKREPITMWEIVKQAREETAVAVKRVALNR